MLITLISHIQRKRLTSAFQNKVDNIWYTKSHICSTCRALWSVSMPCFLRQARPRASGALPIFQSEVAPESITHCNTHTENTVLGSSANQDPAVPAAPHASWTRHVSSCRPGRGDPGGFQSHRWMWRHCLFSTEDKHTQHWWWNYTHKHA